jgi:predicted AAA+ superfamily ATPase
MVILSYSYLAMDIYTLHRALANQWSQQHTHRQSILRSLDLSQDLSKPEISIITGVRRCGKSSYLRQLAESARENFAVIIVEFDDPNLDTFQGSDFNLLIDYWEKLNPGDSRPRLYLFDEIQNVSNWEKWVLHIAKISSAKIVVTGSNATMLSSELGTLLTGRHSTHEMMPLSFSEVLHAARSQGEIAEGDSEELQKIYTRYEKYGGFPRAYIDQDISLLPRYLADFVERDIIARHGARLSRPLKELIKICCSSNTNEINRKRLALHLGIKDDATVKRYMSWFSDCYVFYEIKQFFSSVRKQLRSQSKIYFVDPALAHASAFSILGHDGAFLENAVFLELKRRGYELFYWKNTQTNAEVDFVARKAGEDLMAVQVSLDISDEKTLARELAGLSAVNLELGIKKLLLITRFGKDRQIEFNGCQIKISSFLSWG